MDAKTEQLFEEFLQADLAGLQHSRQHADPGAELMHAQFALKHLLALAVCGHADPAGGIEFLARRKAPDLVLATARLAERGFAEFERAPSRETSRLVVIYPYSMFVAWLVGEFDAGARMLAILRDANLRSHYGDSPLVHAIEDALHALISGAAFVAPRLSAQGAEKLGLAHLQVISDLAAGRDIGASLKSASAEFFRRQKDRKLDLPLHDGRPDRAPARWDFTMVALGAYLQTTAPRFALQAAALRRAAGLER